MQLTQPCVLLTRPLDKSTALEKELRAVRPDMRVVIAPILGIEHLRPPLPLQNFAGVILTSAAAVDGISHWSLPAGFPAFCVGQRTQTAAQEAGLAVKLKRDTAKDLTDELIANPPLAPLVFARGRHVASDMADVLNSAGLETFESIVYDQISCELSQDVIDALLECTHVIVPVYSPRSAALLSAQMPDVPITLIAISANAAEAWSGPKPTATVIADQPNGAAMLRAIGSQPT